MTRLNPSPRIIKVRLMGVAKNLLSTSVFLKLKNIKATPNTPALSKENPN
jgi:hypothetical protein